MNSGQEKPAMSTVVRVYQPGAPSVLRVEQEEDRLPGSGEVRLRQEAIGINFVDILFRDGRFRAPTTPFIPGMEGAGTIEAVGPGVTEFSVGDRVGYFSLIGAYAEARLAPAEVLQPIPAGVSFDAAAAVLAKGATARMLVKQIGELAPGKVVLIHAAAGAVGSLASRWAHALGATVIGTVGTATKKPAAIGSDHVIALDEEDFAVAVGRLTQGKGVDVLIDGVGAATFDKSIPVVRPGGRAILFGAASGEPAIDQHLIAERDIVFSRPSLPSTFATPADRRQASREVFEAFQHGAFGVVEPREYRLDDVAQAHTDLEARRTTGPIILKPRL
jgi:NADPH2:quinone reductase